MDYLKRALTLAAKGNVLPNPMVGAVLVKDGEIIGEGYHEKYGEHHAEINAFNDALNRGYNIDDSTLYVTLEPCAHTGKTPPCVDAILKHRVKKVIIGTKDPHNKVNGKGIETLKENGVEVELLNSNECKKLNKVFNVLITKKRPYIHVKVALTKDGKMTLKKGTQTKITNHKQDIEVHRLRATHDAIMVGKNTVLIDNPRLTCRLKELTKNKEQGKNPTRIIVSTKLDLPLNLNIFSKEANTILITGETDAQKIKEYSKHAKVIQTTTINGKVDMNDALKKVYKEHIYSILVEGGETLITTLHSQNLVDEYTEMRSKLI